MTGAHLLFPGMQTLHVDAVAPAKPFDLPLERTINLLRYSTAQGYHHRAHVQGIVTLYWPGRLVCIRDESQGLCAEIEQTEPLHRGDRVDLVGFPMVGVFTPSMIHALYRPIAAQQGAVPFKVTLEQASSGGRDSDLVTIEGRLIGHDLSAVDPTILLQTGRSVFAAVLPRSYLAEDLRLEEGSLLRITGICSNHADGSKLDSGTGFPLSTSFRILRDSPADVTVLELPSWWNPRHALFVVACALVLALAALIGMMILGQRVKRQTGTIRESEERFRHLATHDSLTQLPNRASILNSLDLAVAKANQTKTPVCVALIDLDHFKTINDTYGHVAGDEVLREAARRLASAIRSTDAIGRYGGEEFLIVFNDMDQERGQAICEMVRRALCERPVAWEGKELTMTCSIGVASATTSQSPVPTLVSIADHAMYTAKMEGRNRVVGASDRTTPLRSDRRSAAIALGQVS
jgi:diguanylate cyclase (GGDEF)-like protein